MEKLTIQEEEAMLYIWELGSCFVKDIVAKYPKPAIPNVNPSSSKIQRYDKNKIQNNKIFSGILFFLFRFIMIPP